MTQTIFLNISNHPSVNWSEAQTYAALQFAGRVLDLPFPEVPPEVDTPLVYEIARQTVDSIPDNVTHAMVMGEFTLVYALVGLLREKGIIPLTATTIRLVEEFQDGSKLSRFEFVRFREYPSQPWPDST
jgi:hypothetical protein